MKILALEPYYGGSHKAFLDGCANYSSHQWDIIHAPPNKWKWRMHHCPITFANEINRRIEQGASWDRLFCSDMLDLPTLLGFCPALASLPSVVYFHENQLSYPLRDGEKRDLNYGFMNMKTALCAGQVWFNSDYHRKEFLNAIDKSLKLMPDKKLSRVSERIAEKTLIVPQGIDSINLKERNANAIPHILWAARWEYDKNPALFFDALSQLKGDFKLSVIGESFRNSPPVFKEAEERFKDKIIHWGYQESREQYLQVLHEADIVVSTADHEFFGISVIEALHAGCFPVVPEALAYPEVIDIKKHPESFYDGTVQALVDKLNEVLPQTNLFSHEQRLLRNQVSAKYSWDALGPLIDGKLNEN